MNNKFKVGAGGADFFQFVLRAPHYLIHHSIRDEALGDLWELYYARVSQANQLAAASVAVIQFCSIVWYSLELSFDDWLVTCAAQRLRLMRRCRSWALVRLAVAMLELFEAGQVQFQGTWWTASRYCGLTRRQNGSPKTDQLTKESDSVSAGVPDTL